jgi:hypothetical protein
MNPSELAIPRDSATVVTRSRAVGRQSAAAIYIVIALASLLIALVGFWPRYFGPMVGGTLRTIPIIHVHAAVMMGWLFLLILQVVLVARGRRALHMKVGNLGMVWGVVVILVGWATSITRFGERVQAGQLEQAGNRLFAPLTDMLVFAPFLAAAWVYRRKPQAHKRLIVVASTILLIAAVHRIRIFTGTQLPLPQLMLVWLSPILLGMIYDLVRARRVYPVYLLGIGAVLFMKFGRVPLRDTSAWRSFTRWLATFYV